MFTSVTKMAVTPFDPPYIPETPYAAFKHHGSVFDRMGVIADRRFTLRDLDFDQRTFIYELDPVGLLHVQI